jgi:hypothetical protein
MTLLGHPGALCSEMSIARREISARKPCHRGRRRRKVVVFGRYPLPRLSGFTGGQSEAWRPRGATNSGEAANQQRRAVEATAACSAGSSPLRGTVLVAVTEPQNRKRYSQEYHEVKSSRHSERWRTVRTWFRRLANGPLSCSRAREPPRSMRWCQRRCNWNFWTPRIRSCR